MHTWELARLHASGDNDHFILNKSLDIQKICGRTQAHAHAHLQTYIYTRELVRLHASSDDDFILNTSLDIQ